MSQILPLENYKKLRGIEALDTSRDAALTLALPAAEDAVERYCDRDFRAAPVTGPRDFPFTGRYNALDDYTALTAVSVDGRALPATAYRAAPTPLGDVYFGLEVSGRLPSPAMGFESNLDTWQGGSFSTLTVTATWGWPEALPESLQLVVATIADEVAPAAGAGGVQSESIADLTYVYQRQADEALAQLPPLVTQLLRPFRRIAL